FVALDARRFQCLDKAIVGFELPSAHCVRFPSLPCRRCPFDVSLILCSEDTNNFLSPMFRYWLRHMLWFCMELRYQLIPSVSSGLLEFSPWLSNSIPKEKAIDRK